MIFSIFVLQHNPKNFEKQAGSPDIKEFLGRTFHQKMCHSCCSIMYVVIVRKGNLKTMHGVGRINLVNLQK